jgi:hypothetical protein
MLAFTRKSWFPKLPSLDSIKHAIYMLAPDRFRTQGIGANKRFVEQIRYVQNLFVKTNAGVGATDAKVFVCRKCASRSLPAVARELTCTRVVLDRSVVGKVIGRMRWRLPECTTCDHELSLEVTDPILIDHGRLSEGYVDIPDDILLFFDATIEDA